MLFHLYIELCQHKHLIKVYEIWTNPKDWREFTTGDLVCAVIKTLMTHPQKYVSQTLAFGTGVKSSMESVVGIFAKEFNIELSDVIFHKNIKQALLNKQLVFHIFLILTDIISM